MNNNEHQDESQKAKRNRSVPSGSRKVGYVFAIIISFVIIYLLRHAREWGLTFLTQDFEKVLFFIEISIYANIIAYILFIFYDHKWFKHLVQAITNIAGALALIMVYVIFPFLIANENWIKWLKIGILVLFIITVISILVEMIKGFRYLTKDPEAI